MSMCDANFIFFLDYTEIFRSYSEDEKLKKKQGNAFEMQQENRWNKRFLPDHRWSRWRLRRRWATQRSSSSSTSSPGHQSPCGVVCSTLKHQQTVCYVWICIWGAVVKLEGLHVATRWRQRNKFFHFSSFKVSEYKQYPFLVTSKTLRVMDIVKSIYGGYAGLSNVDLGF